MAFTNQFALTVELTRLLPPIGWAANKAGNAILSRARELYHSGLDIVVEEDLADVFGRCKISPALASSFKTLVAKSSSNISLLEGIVLQGGPGPTVLRALQEPPYFAMVIQLSLLAWAFHTDYLATAIADALRKRLEGAPTLSGLPSSPDRNGVLGVLKACESQTAGFNWNMMIDAVSTTLGYRTDNAPTDIPCFVLQGLIDMFPMVQTLPADRMIHIQIPVGKKLDSGISVLVVWAHHILNLEVLVRPHGHKGRLGKAIRFGNSGQEQIFIEEVSPHDEASVTLLDAHREHLLSIRPEPDADIEGNLIGSVRRVAARGWGNAILMDTCGNFPDLRKRSEAIIQELQMVVSAFAFIIARNLIKDDNDRDFQEDTVGTKATQVYDVDEQHLLHASRFLFDNPHITHGQIDIFVRQYTCQAFDEHLLMPSALEASRIPLLSKAWNLFRRRARDLSIFMLALAHIVNLEDCENLMFAGLAFSNIAEHPLSAYLDEWKGITALPIADDAWLRAIAVPLLGHRQNVENLPWEKICLISDRGWSAWIPTLADIDPGYVRAGSLMLGRGTPCRNGIWKRGILDHTRRGCFFNFVTPPQRAESCGQATSLRCAEKVTLENPYCGEGDDQFLVSARFRTNRIQKTLQRVGYKELHRCLWWAQVSKGCRHGGRSPGNVKLDVGCAAVAGFGNYLEHTGERILVFLTAHSVGARWLGLASLPWLSIDGEGGTGAPLRQILLRSNDCCYRCVVDEAALQAGEWFIILQGGTTG
ncbi:MAG: hypothetical protein Q9208_002630 [Pyrenodesmia sp. 3 TL-2023]